jgi:hypothetical protein
MMTTYQERREWKKKWGDYNSKSGREEKHI